MSDRIATTEPRGCPIPGACSALAEIDRLRKIEAAARVQHEAYGAYPGLVEALKNAE